MNTYPLLVGFSLAIGVGLIADALFSTVFTLGWQLLRGQTRRRNTLKSLAAGQSKKQ